MKGTALSLAALGRCDCWLDVALTGVLSEGQDEPIAVAHDQFSLVVNAVLRTVNNVGAA